MKPWNRISFIASLVCVHGASLAAEPEVTWTPEDTAPELIAATKNLLERARAGRAAGTITAEQPSPGPELRRSCEGIREQAERMFAAVSGSKLMNAFEVEVIGTDFVIDAQSPGLFISTRCDARDLQDGTEFSFWMPGADVDGLVWSTCSMPTLCEVGAKMLITPRTEDGAFWVRNLWESLVIGDLLEGTCASGLVVDSEDDR